MNDDQLAGSLKSTGMGCFIKYFEAFSNSNISNEDLIDALMKIEGYKDSGAQTRVTQSRRIINNNRSIDALNIVVSSNRAKDWVISKAQMLINQLSEEN